jgi:hypothetical protein
MIPAARTDPWRCGDCGAVYELATRSIEVGLVRLALTGEEGFQLGSEGIDAELEPLLEPCECGGRLNRERSGSDPVLAAKEAQLDSDRLPPLAERGWAVLEASADPRLQRLAGLWRSRALHLLGRDAELGREQQLELRLEERLSGLQAEIERARAAGDEDAAQAAHARYIELGTTFVRRFASADPA